ncbi:MAG: hypothetical protein RR475_10105 [Clostridia bacterium]
MDLCFTFYHKDTLNDPIHLKMIHSRGIDTSACEPEPNDAIAIYDSEPVTIRLDDIGDSICLDRNVILLHCESKSDWNLSIRQGYNDRLFAGKRVQA